MSEEIAFVVICYTGGFSRLDIMQPGEQPNKNRNSNRSRISGMGDAQIEECVLSVRKFLDHALLLMSHAHNCAWLYSLNRNLATVHGYL